MSGLGKQNFRSWGQYPESFPHRVISLPWVDASLFVNKPENNSLYLAYGQGRSYGDSCQNNSETLIDTRQLNHIHFFDSEQGVLRCEAGVTLSDILSVIVPYGWFLPVTPGTQYVTVAGAVANDVHGKNHHRVGSFGNHVTQLELYRSNDESFICSPEQNTDLFHSTIGGLGLTGLIKWVEIKLKKVITPYISSKQKPFSCISDFFLLEGEDNSEYNVAWIDTTSTSSKLGRGIFFSGEHSHQTLSVNKPTKDSSHKLNIPINFPNFTLNKYTVKAFNKLYYFTNKNRQEQSQIHYALFFYPLDNIDNWNRMYGKRGFFQHQCVVPVDDGQEVITEILKLVSKKRMASFLSVLKKFGNIPSVGMMSFPREGYTLALDFPNYGSRTLNFLNEIDKLVQSVNGAIYPAKDARMSAEMFAQSFPGMEEFKRHIDPSFSSSFWRRVTGS